MTIDEIFKYKRAVFDKLIDYGFKLNNEVYEFERDILDSVFELYVYVSREGKVSTKVLDKKSQDEYVLYLINGVGGFSSQVKTEVEYTLQEISDKCFVRDVFKSKQAKEIIEYVKSKYGDDLEYLWKKFPNYAVWRRKDNNKWYGVLLRLSKRKLGVDNDEIIEVINLRIEPEEIERLVDKKNFFEGYHMNKKHWVTICLDESVSTNKILDYVNTSYLLVET